MRREMGIWGSLCLSMMKIGLGMLNEKEFH